MTFYHRQTLRATGLVFGGKVNDHESIPPFYEIISGIVLGGQVNKWF